MSWGQYATLQIFNEKWHTQKWLKKEFNPGAQKYCDSKGFREWFAMPKMPVYLYKFYQK